MVAFNAHMHAEGSQLKENENIYTYQLIGLYWRKSSKTKVAHAIFC